LDHRIGSPSFVVVAIIDNLVGNSVEEVDTAVVDWVNTAVIVGMGSEVIADLDSLGLAQTLVLDITIIIGTSWVAAITIVVIVIDQVAYMARSCPS